MNNLPVELQLQIIHFLTPQSMAKLNCVWNLAKLSNEEITFLWKNKKYESVWFDCISKGYINLIKLITEYHILDINIQSSLGHAAIHYVCGYNQIDILRLLISKNVNLWIEDNSGYVGFQYASAKGSVNIVKLLIEQNPSKNNKYYEKALFLARIGKHRDIIKIIKELLYC